MSKEIDDYLEQSLIDRAKDIEFERRKKIVGEKELDLKEKRVEIAFENLVKSKEEVEKSKNVKFGKMSPEAVQKLLDDNNDYLEAAKHPIPFINSEFDTIVPFFRKNLILITAASGSGKSTAVANIVYGAMKKTNPITGKPYRMLILTNEEAPEDFYNRLTCFVKGWQYSNHNKFTEEQVAEFDRFIKTFTEEDNINVIGDVYEGVPGWTTTVEGVVTIFDNIIRDKEHYDFVILDYYQNIIRSRENPELNEYEAQRILSNEFDRIKNVFGGAIIVMAQIDALADEKDKTPYRIRLKGSKLIVTKSTFICEIVPQYGLYRSDWHVYKSRFTDSTKAEIKVGFHKGKYVPYSIDFQKYVSKLIEENAEKTMKKKLGMVNGDLPSEENKDEENG